jgi:hypothetical protein
MFGIQEGSLNMNFETITKQEWVTVVQWISLRWEHLKWDDQQVKSLYEDFKLFPPDVVWTTLNRYYDNGHKYFNSIEFRKACLDEYAFWSRENRNKLTLSTGEVMERNAGGLIEYLKVNGFESFAHATWSSFMERLNKDKLIKTERHLTKVFQKNEPWESAKDKWLTIFQPEWKVDWMEERREVREKEKLNG